MIFLSKCDVLKNPNTCRVDELDAGYAYLLSFTHSFVTYWFTPHYLNIMNLEVFVFTSKSEYKDL